MQRMIAPILLSLMLGLGGALSAQEEETEKQPGPLPPGAAAGEVDLLAIRDGEKLILREGKPLRFAAIRAPYPPIGQQPGRWPPVQLLSRRIEDLAAEGLIVHPTGIEDRYGSRLANLWSLKEKAWLAEVLAGEGLVVVAPSVQFDPDYSLVVAAEQAARGASLGIWSNPAHKVICADDAYDGIDQLRIVQGRILKTDLVSGFLFLNFGSDWRRDFTIRIKAGRGARRAEQLELARELEGHQIEVRGWIYYYGGPLIDLDNLGQLVLVEGAGAKC